MSLAPSKRSSPSLCRHATNSWCTPAGGRAGRSSRSQRVGQPAPRSRHRRPGCGRAWHTLHLRQPRQQRRQQRWQQPCSTLLGLLRVQAGRVQHQGLRQAAVEQMGRLPQRLHHQAAVLQPSTRSSWRTRSRWRSSPCSTRPRWPFPRRRQLQQIPAAYPCLRPCPQTRERAKQGAAVSLLRRRQWPRPRCSRLHRHLPSPCQRPCLQGRLHPLQPSRTLQHHLHGP
mmetsp:Transcript_19349/g.49226  ORF Transcript_19349/g.49226 Transcript_19349/m.49226 type:complete len:227 (-) Transcript_19349:907-1587(-)